MDRRKKEKKKGSERCRQEITTTERNAIEGDGQRE